MPCETKGRQRATKQAVPLCGAEAGFLESASKVASSTGVSFECIGLCNDSTDSSTLSLACAADGGQKRGKCSVARKALGPARNLPTWGCCCFIYQTYWPNEAVLVCCYTECSLALAFGSADDSKSGQHKTLFYAILLYGLRKQQAHARTLSSMPQPISWEQTRGGGEASPCR